MQWNGGDIIKSPDSLRAVLGYLLLWRKLGFPEIWEQKFGNAQRFLIPYERADLHLCGIPVPKERLPGGRGSPLLV